jgi:hypothetical protein
MDPHILNISPFGFYMLWIAVLALLPGNVLHAAQRARQLESAVGTRS